MKSEYPNKISLRLVATTVVVALAAGFLLSMLQVYASYKAAHRDIDRQVNVLMDALTDAAARSVDLLDDKLAQEVVEGLIQQPFIVAAQIHDDEDFALASSRKVPPIEFENWLASFLFAEDRSFNRALRLDTAYIDRPGKMTVTVDMATAMAPFVSNSVLEFATGVIRSLILATVLYFAFHRGLTQPLSNLVRDVSNINPDQPGEQRLNVPAQHKRDELGKLASQINMAFDATQVLLDNLRSTNRALTASEEALRKRSWELEQEVERTRNTSLELMRTKEEAVAANRAKSVFLANVSHELRTPLNAIIGFSSIMSEQMFGPIGHKKYREYLEDIRTSSEHLAEVLGEVLDLAKIEAGQVKLEEEIFDLAVMCKEAVSLILGQATQKNFTVLMDNNATNASVMGDRLRVKQAVLNLLSNAVKFTPKSGGNVQLTIADAAAGDILITVTDQGIGIAPEEQELIFSPFMRSSSALSRSHEGTGLGLSLVTAFVEKHGGHVELTSALGNGSEFTIILPAQRVQKAAQAS